MKQPRQRPRFFQEISSKTLVPCNADFLQCETPPLRISLSFVFQRGNMSQMLLQFLSERSERGGFCLVEKPCYCQNKKALKLGLFSH